MGTRNVTAVYHNGAYRIAQYGQWDGYPEGNGVEILAFLQNMDRAAFEKALTRVRFITPADKAFTDEVERAKDWTQKFPHLSRDAGAGILQMVQDNKSDELLLSDEINFCGDSLMCEWAYVIDLDKNQLEVFKGFNETKLDPSERFADIAPRENEHCGPYYQVKLAKAWPLDALPTEDEFLKAFTQDETEESKEDATASYGGGIKVEETK